MMNAIATVEIRCPFCGKIHEVEVPLDGYMAWGEGMPIQEAMPNVSAGIREALISGLCADCQASIFNEDDPDDGDLDYEAEWEDDDLECGFDPYEGTYTFDC